MLRVQLEWHVALPTEDWLLNVEPILGLHIYCKTLIVFVASMYDAFWVLRGLTHCWEELSDAWHARRSRKARLISRDTRSSALQALFEWMVSGARDEN